MSSDIVQVDKDISESELLDELAALARPERKPGGVTVKELMATLSETNPQGLSEATARRILRQQERAGILYSVPSLDNGHPVKVWYRKV